MGRVDGVGRAEPSCHRELGFELIDRDDLRAPAIRAPWIAARPTPPHPKTATVEPGSIRAVLSTAPTPVVTPHPMSAARSSGMSLPIFTSAFSCTSIFSA